MFSKALKKNLSTYIKLTEFICGYETWLMFTTELTPSLYNYGGKPLYFILNLAAASAFVFIIIAIKWVM